MACTLTAVPQAVGNAVQTAIGLGAIVVPGAEHRADGAPELLGRVLRERLAGFALDRRLIVGDHLLPMVGAQIGIEREAVEVLVIVQDVLEHAMVDAQHHVGIHLDEAAVAVVGEARIAGLGDEALHRLIVETEIEDGIHHARHRGARARAHRHEQRRGHVAELRPDRRADLGERRFRVCLQAVGQCAAVGDVGGAHLGGDREARRHRQAEARHLRKIGALAAQQVLHVGGAIRPAGTEQIHALGRRVGPCRTGCVRHAAGSGR